MIIFFTPATIPAILFMFLVLGGVPAAHAFTAEVISVADGDTITVLDHDKQKIKIRLYGIDCPERKQPFGNRARQATRDAVHGKVVYVTPVEKDRYGRTVAIVAAPGREMLNSWLVKEGLAWVYPQFCKQADICDRLRELEQEAREGKVGLWRDGNAVPPWEWRRERR